MKRYQLAKAGVSASEGIERFSGDKKLYEEMLTEFPREPNYAALCRAIENKDGKAAFSAAHSLKGVAGNLSMNRLFEDIVPLVEVLRAGCWDNVDQYLEKVKQDYQEVVQAIQA